MKTKNDGNAVKKVKNVIEQGWDAVKPQVGGNNNASNFFVYPQSENQTMIDTAIKARKK